MSNGRLLAAAKAARFDVFVTADQNIRYQQNIGGTTLAVVVLSTTDWSAIKGAAGAIKLAVARAKSSVVVDVQIADDRSSGSR